MRGYPVKLNIDGEIVIADSTATDNIVVGVATYAAHTATKIDVRLDYPSVTYSLGCFGCAGIGPHNEDCYANLEQACEEAAAKNSKK